MQSVSQLYKSKVKLIECTPQLDDFVSFQWWMILHKLLIIMCSSRKYPYLPRRRDFFLTPPHPSGNSGKSSYISLYFLIFQNPPPPPPIPQEIPIPSVGRVWIFSGTAQWVPNPALELRVGWGGSAYPAGFSSFCILFFLHQNKGKSGRPQSTTDNELQS